MDIRINISIWKLKKRASECEVKGHTLYTKMQKNENEKWIMKCGDVRECHQCSYSIIHDNDELQFIYSPCNISVGIIEKRYSRSWLYSMVISAVFGRLWAFWRLFLALRVGVQGFYTSQVNNMTKQEMCDIFLFLLRKGSPTKIQ